MTEKNSVNNDKQLVVFQLGNETFGADISQIREIIRVGDITSIPQAPDFIHGVINLRGQVTTVVNMRRKLAMPDRGADGNTRIIVLEAGRNTVGMMVDSVTEVKYINSGQIEPFSGLIAGDERHSCILGVCKLKDQLLILVDLQKALEGVIDVGTAGTATEQVKTS